MIETEGKNGKKHKHAKKDRKRGPHNKIEYMSES
jgi:hypothetical protein